MNSALRIPSSDFGRVRDRRESVPLYVDVDLTTARTTDAQALVLPIAGNSFYIDANPNDGICTVQFQDTNFDRSTAPLYCGAGTIFKVPFTQVLIRNAAQAGKKIRIVYGVDIDFIAGSIAAIQTQSAPTAFTPVQTGPAVAITSGLFLASNSSRKYLLIQNNSSTDVFFNLAGGTAVLNQGIKIAAGGSLEFTTQQPTTQINAIAASAIAANLVTVIEG
ncbi:MAG: hypothetical protein EBR27_09265 [Betaproteobacteria bacterium]|nr:hypothetical protein [Betaproteobacteria bacterium]